ncbi:PAS domain S-box-containing protein [Rhizobium leguminosarum]|uniref:histidine kinase n=1 Tax=Rhizobium leguminosarum TaxID=384 RepID=A0AAE2SX75_RHILE|nr:MULTISPECIES: ATP-binding protein [Rhizobium]MBB4291491.1 PAS domain S-box-containing protein [Rhizobium leguminosarum]MBB4296188.1 PAS domain S-box-containing protein [Rhizobium leguminosarum]MBB4308553.1 PAS domain S-box-containing protein [Rhizobium leguminosarum]MBB4416388.1 PAS domain S-box-containing protein [Rhizobium leguminosarum]MBB4430645.1 PAS domain S-box-containing protein [Rhizobium esperanzae]
MVDAVPGILAFFDGDLICRFANEYHHSWYRSSPHEMVGRHLRDIIGDKDFAARAPHLARVRRGETSYFEVPVPMRNGSFRDAAVTYTPKMGPTGFDGVYILTFDVAVLHQRYHSVFDGTAAGFWVVDYAKLPELLRRHGIHGADALSQAAKSSPQLIRGFLDELRVVHLNQKACQIFDVDVNDAMDKPFGQWWPDDSLQAFAQQLVALLNDEPFFEIETVMRTRTGERRDVLMTCAFVKKDPDATTVTIGTTDIRARVMKEQQLAHAQTELAHAARVALLGELMASIAHEVNQPLAAIAADGSGALRWLSKEEPDLGEAKAAITRMVSESRRASEVIARTKNLAVKAGPTTTNFDINRMIEDTLVIVRRQVINLGAEIETRFDDVCPEIRADRVQLQQVLINLIINAAQAVCGRAEPRSVKVTSSFNEEYVTVSVEDNGPGVGDNASRLFDVFFTTKETGMGMGLAISRTILEAHGGKIELVKSSGKGATFAFSVPRPDAAGSEERA